MHQVAPGTTCKIIRNAVKWKRIVFELLSVWKAFIYTSESYIVEEHHSSKRKTNSDKQTFATDNILWLQTKKWHGNKRTGMLDGFTFLCVRAYKCSQLFLFLSSSVCTDTHLCILRMKYTKWMNVSQIDIFPPPGIFHLNLIVHRDKTMEKRIVQLFSAWDELCVGVSCAIQYFGFFSGGGKER